MGLLNVYNHWIETRMQNRLVTMKIAIFIHLSVRDVKEAAYTRIGRKGKEQKRKRLGQHRQANVLRQEKLPFDFYCRRLFNLEGLGVGAGRR